MGLDTESKEPIKIFSGQLAHFLDPVPLGV